MATSRRITSYTNAILRWKLNENTAIGTVVFANSGSYGSGSGVYDLTIAGTGTAKAQAVLPGVRGVLQRGVRFYGPRAAQHNGLIGGTPAAVPAAGAQLTVSCWYMQRVLNATATATILRKMYSATLSSTTAPSVQLGIATTGQLRCSITTGTNGAGTFTSGNGSTVIPVNVWSHLAMTYDGINVRIYLNGTQDGVFAKTGNIDWNTLGGPWAIGYAGGTGVTFDNSEVDGVVEEAIVELGVIPEEMLRHRYLRGLGLRMEEAA